MKSACDMAIEILGATNDGDDLTPSDLCVVQAAVNSGMEGLTEQGEIFFYELWTRCEAGTYKPKWFHGHEHLTLDHEGYVDWRGKNIEHYNLSWAYTEAAEAAAAEVVRRCLALEERGLVVNTMTVVWHWPDSLDGTPEGAPL
jgi:hypothetical protein